MNPVLISNPYPLPNAEDLFATLAGGKLFSKLDLSNAYQQLELMEESQKKSIHQEKISVSAGAEIETHWMAEL